MDGVNVSLSRRINTNSSFAVSSLQILGKFVFGHEKKLAFPFGYKKFQSYLMAMA
jgi:hypothetical protein